MNRRFRRLERIMGPALLVWLVVCVALAFWFDV